MTTIRGGAALATASILLVACTSANGGPTPSSAGAGAPTETESAAATSSPPSSPVSDGTAGAIATPVMTPPQALTRHSTEFEPPLTLEAPSKWLIADDSTEVFVVADAEGTAPIVLQANPIIGSDAKDCEGLAKADGATSIDGIVASISMNSKLVTSNPHQVTIDGRTGQAIDVALERDWTGTCSWSGGQRAALVLTTQHPPGPFFGLLESEQARLIFLNVGEDVVLIAVSAQDAAMFDTVTSLAMPIIESVRFTP